MWKPSYGRAEGGPSQCRGASRTGRLVGGAAAQSRADARRANLPGRRQHPDLDSAHRIFSVMNSRGLDLSPTDIFKARIIGDLGAERRGVRHQVGGRGRGPGPGRLRRPLPSPSHGLRQEAGGAGTAQGVPGAGAQPATCPARPRRSSTTSVRPYADAYVQIRDAGYEAASGARRSTPGSNGSSRSTTTTGGPPPSGRCAHHGTTLSGSTGSSVRWNGCRPACSSGASTPHPASPVTRNCCASSIGGRAGSPRLWN